MVESQSPFRILSLIAFETVKSLTEELQKANILEKLFPFSNFSNFWNLERFWYLLKKMFLINYKNFRSYATFLLKF